MTDTLGDRIKGYEDNTRVPLLLPIFARLDGKNFHAWTRGLDKPFDDGLSNLMIDTTKYLVDETNATMGYTQSDEITLTWYLSDMKSQIFMGGKIQKMVSVLASTATAYFNNNLIRYFERAPARGADAIFDARVFAVPTLEEGVNVFLWRELDATKNSISAAAQSVFPHKSLQGLHSKELQEKLWSEAGINWNDYPAKFKRGTYVQRQTIERSFTAKEIDCLPPLHEARNNPDLKVARKEVQILDLPPLSKIKNKVEVIYYGAQPDEA